MSGGHGTIVRPATPADMPRVWDLLHGLADYERLSAEVSGSGAALEAAVFAERPAVECLVAERTGALVGYALFYPTFSSFRTTIGLWLEDLYVEPALRGAGVGRLLLAELSRVALMRGANGIDWEVLDWNAPSIAFYERIGARRAGAEWREYRLDADAMRRLIGP